MAKTIEYEVVALTVSEHAWRKVGGDDDNATRLLATLHLNGLSMHLEAIQVEYDEERSVQIAVGGEGDDECLDQLHAAVGADGSWNTMEIFGNEYVVFASPYCS